MKKTHQKNRYEKLHILNNYKKLMKKSVLMLVISLIRNPNQ